MSQDHESGSHRVGEGRPGEVGTDTTYHHTERAIPVQEERGQPSTLQHETVAVHHGDPVRREAERPVNVAVADRHDGVRWGPVWAGLLTALTLFLLLELMFYAFGWLNLDPGVNQSGSSTGLITGILALVAFFVGGLVAGATALWKNVVSGLLHGFLVWALGVVAFIGLTFFGASALLGSFGSLTHELGVGPQQVQSTTQVSPSEASQAQSQAKDSAQPAFWGLLAPLAASMVGGLVGSMIWPRKRDTEPVRVDR